MKIEFPALQSEPLIYFLVHSGVFVLALASAFFIIGLWFGALVWGRFKKQTNLLRAENDGQRQEIAVLKRRLAELSVRPSTGPLPSAALLTEVLPGVVEIFPERYGAMTAATQMPTPGSRVEMLPERFFPLLSALPDPPADPPTADTKIATGKMRRPKPTIRSKMKKEPPPVPAVVPEAAVPETAGEAAPLEPFGFLLGPAPVPEAQRVPHPAVSALSAIIQRGARQESAVKPERVPEVAAVLPEMDPVLGLIYREVPPDADDLTRIRGIAAVLEKRLHDLGVHTYRQIASWNEAHVRAFSARLAFKDRIVRERWVEQARVLGGGGAV